jgi:hypothetical protein
MNNDVNNVVNILQSYPTLDKNENHSHNTSTVTKPEKLPKGWNRISIDSEYKPVTDAPTIPLTVQLSNGVKHSEYIHPNHPYNAKELHEIRRQLDLAGESKNTLKVFRDCAILEFLADSYGIEYRPLEGKRKKVITLDIYMFFSFKDIEFLFENPDVYKQEILPRLERVRRIATAYNRAIPLQYEIPILSERGKLEWHAVSLNLNDVCAMQGAGGLEKYMLNVGMDIGDKGTYTKAEKGDMQARLLEDAVKFLTYARSDVALAKLHDLTIDFFNKIAELIGVEPRETWGLSTGKIVASMVSDWVAQQVNIPLTDVIGKVEIEGVDVDYTRAGLYQYTRLSSPESIKQLSHITGNKDLLYLGMTDGGRCVKERPHIHKLDGVLIDIDIASCYANGLLNQPFPVGNPAIIFIPMSWKTWEKKYKKYLVPGLWVARISWKNAPFAQDLLISKDERQFTAWDLYQRQFNDETASDKDASYDASMYLMTRDVNHAVLTHDLYQVIDEYGADRNEKAWIKENATIDSFAYYPSNSEVDNVVEEMLEIAGVEGLRACGLAWQTDWKRVALADLLNILIPERNKHKSAMKAFTTKYKVEITTAKKEFGLKSDEEALLKILSQTDVTEYMTARSTQEFIKLINNTIYGCIASCFFATNGTGISNFIVGNNITARARTLAWCMAKGFHSVMSVTDGGVFELNKVLTYKEKSLAIFEAVSRDNFIDDSRHKVVEQTPLFGVEVPKVELENAVSGSGNYIVSVEKMAWKHLKGIFSELDIFKKDQFSFEVKQGYTSLELRNKSDYRLKNEITGDETIKVRGLRKSGDRTEVKIFDDIREEKGNKYTQISTEMLGLSDYRDNMEFYKVMLPHDQISREKSFYTITPLGNRFVNSEHRKLVLKLYDMLRVEDNAKVIAYLASVENILDLNSLKVKLAADKKRNAKKKTKD